MATISSLGIGSGLDLNGLLDKLNSAEQLKLQPIVAQQAKQQTKLSAFGRLQSALSSLQSAIQTLGNAQTFQKVTTSVSGSGLTAAAMSNAVAGSYSISVNTLAQAQSLASSGVADTTTSLGSGTLTISQGSGSTATSMSINLSGSSSSLAGVRDAINAQHGGVTATIVNDGSATSPYHLVLSSTATGTDAQMTVGFSGTGTLSNLLGYSNGSGVMSQTVAASNASLSVNGIAITRQSNVINDAVQGVALSLTQAGTNSVLTVASDNASIKSAVTGFVNAYNSLQDTMSSLTSYDAATKKAGDLLGDATLSSVQSQLRKVMSSALSGGALNSLSSIGVELQLGGKLQVNDSKLDGLISNNLSGLGSFFTGSATSPGFSGQLGATLDGMLKDGGSLSSVTAGIKGQLKTLGDSYTRMQSNIDDTIARYRKQFTQLDQLVSQMNSTTTYLTQQFNALSGTKG